MACMEMSDKGIFLYYSTYLLSLLLKLCHIVLFLIKCTMPYWDSNVFDNAEFIYFLLPFNLSDYLSELYPDVGLLKLQAYIAKNYLPVSHVPFF